jgi:hypothetical protein
LYEQARRGFRAARRFEVRYWTPSALRDLFQREVGAPHLSADAFFAPNGEVAVLPAARHPGATARLSAFFRQASERLPPLKYVADSVIVSALKR